MMIAWATVVLVIATITLAIITCRLQREAKKHRQGDLIIRLLEIFNREHLPMGRKLNPKEEIRNTIIIDDNELRGYLNFFEQLGHFEQKGVLELDFIDESFGQYIETIFIINSVSCNHIKNSRIKKPRNFEKLIELYKELWKQGKIEKDKVNEEFIR